MHDIERRRLARELHNGAGQALAALKINLSLAARSAESLEPRAARALAESIKTVEACAVEIRAVCDAIYPPLLDELGLVPALRVLLDSLGVTCQMPSRLERLAPDEEIALYRIIEWSAGCFPKPGNPAVVVRRLRDSIVIEWSGRAKEGRQLAAVRRKAREIGARMTVSKTRMRVAFALAKSKAAPA
jgi:signal transduction histidine kinase